MACTGLLRLVRLYKGIIRKNKTNIIENINTEQILQCSFGVQNYTLATDILSIVSDARNPTPAHS